MTACGWKQKKAEARAVAVVAAVAAAAASDLQDWVLPVPGFQAPFEEHAGKLRLGELTCKRHEIPPGAPESDRG